MNAQRIWDSLGSDEKRKDCLADLLAALEDALDYLDSSLGDCDEGCECILHPIRAAIAKARPEAVAS